ncbi:hypothetical protein HOLleu_06147 [Holothuria leucospilota]|uniref:Secreted protein n=1 Tax=Holothuria leucospilota TaxID=206669 RepID=A0A9Q1HJD6_HOLLE|nr:hypothetical protein HOLleu_06147 [Holothuria leucospilota]
MYHLVLSFLHFSLVLSAFIHSVRFQMAEPIISYSKQDGDGNYFGPLQHFSYYSFLALSTQRVGTPSIFSAKQIIFCISPPFFWLFGPHWFVAK